MERDRRTEDNKRTKGVRQIVELLFYCVLFDFYSAPGVYGMSAVAVSE